MSGATRRSGVAGAVASFLAAPRFVTALTVLIVGSAIFAFLLRQTIGWPGLGAITTTLVVLASGSIAARWNEVEWRGLLPISLIAFVGWACVSFVWSPYHWATAGGLAYLLAYTLLGVYVALMRDTIQIVRAFGDALRFALGLSLALEIVSGLLIDTPIRFLQIQGNLGTLGPIQGITGVRNQLGILALVALITFGTEFRTHLVPRGLSIGSVIGAAAVLLLTRSPLAWGTLVVIALAATALYGLRRVAVERQRFWQIGILVATLTLAIVAWIFRSPIVDLFNAGGDLTYRLQLWYRTWDLVSIRPLQGWGWVGIWRGELAPFQVFSSLSARDESSASNAYLDVWFQLGLIGFVIFVGLVGLAFVRSWLLASRKRSIVFAWPALTLAALITTALAESSVLVEFGWLTFVVCCVKAAEQLSWRRAFESHETLAPSGGLQ